MNITNTTRRLPGDWPVRFYGAAVGDMEALYHENRRLYEAVLRGLTMLSAEPDPVHPRSPIFNVCRSYPEARGCYRVKVVRGDWRVIMRIMETRAGYTYHVEPDECLHDDADEQYIQVIMVAERDGTTYAVKLARRWEKVRVG